MPLSSDPTLLVPYLLQLLGLSRQQIDGLGGGSSSRPHSGLQPAGPPLWPMDIDAPPTPVPAPAVAGGGNAAPPPKPPSAALSFNVTARPFVPAVAAAPPVVQQLQHPSVQRQGSGGYGNAPDAPKEEARTAATTHTVGAGLDRTNPPPGSSFSAAGRGPAVAAAAGAGAGAAEVPPSSDLSLPAVLQALTADLGPLAEELLREEFEELFDSVVSPRASPYPCYGFGIMHPSILLCCLTVW